MKTYSVKQISDMLDTNPETVRRWIRQGKLESVQISKKDGHVVSETDLQKFLNATPKYTAKLAGGLAGMSAVAGGAVLAGGAIAGVLGLYAEKKMIDIGILPDDLIDFLKQDKLRLQAMILQKEKLISQTEQEILTLKNQIMQYDELLSKE